MKLTIVKKGGPGSGHRGHAGIPGEQGGSLPGKGSLASAYVDIKRSIKRDVDSFTDYVRPSKWERENLEGDLEFAEQEIIDSVEMDVGIPIDSVEESHAWEDFRKTPFYIDMVKRQALNNMLVDMTDKQRKDLRKENA